MNKTVKINICCDNPAIFFVRGMFFNILEHVEIHSEDKICTSFRLTFEKEDVKRNEILRNDSLLS